MNDEILNEEIVLDVIPIMIGEMYPTKEEIYHYKIDNYFGGVKFMIGEIKKDFERNTGFSHGIILNKGMVVEMF